MALSIDFSEQTVLVTGGTKGVGRGIAQRFADAGARVAVCARNRPDDLPEDWHFVSADVRDGQAAFAMIDEVVAHFGRLDVLVNNVGGTPAVNTSTAPARISERIIQLNLLSAIYCSQQANSHMQNQPTGGVIINISSVCAGRPSPFAAAYGAAKAGLNNYSNTSALEWAPKVRVNCVTAGMVRTELAHLFYGSDGDTGGVESTVPLGRLAEPSEIGDVCVYLASPMASYVSGANLIAHGGGEKPPFIDAGTLADAKRP